MGIGYGYFWVYLLNSTMFCLAPQSKDASEVMEDSQGRWFPFVVTSDSVLVLEKKSVPEHLQSLPCIDAPTPLGQVLRELEDGGEVGGGDVNHIVYQKVLKYNVNPLVCHNQPLYFNKSCFDVYTYESIVGSRIKSMCTSHQGSS